MYTSALTDTANFFSITKSQNDFGSETETEVALYTDVPGRLGEYKRGPSIKSDEGAQRNFVSQYTFQTTPNYNGAEKNDRLVIDGSKYIVIEKRALKGMTSSPKLILYIIEKMTDET